MADDTLILSRFEQLIHFARCAGIADPLYFVACPCTTSKFYFSHIDVRSGLVVFPCHQPIGVAGRFGYWIKLGGQFYEVWLKDSRFTCSIHIYSRPQRYIAHTEFLTSSDYRAPQGRIWVGSSEIEG